MSSTSMRWDQTKHIVVRTQMPSRYQDKRLVETGTWKYWDECGREVCNAIQTNMTDNRPKQDTWLGRRTSTDHKLSRNTTCTNQSSTSSSALTKATRLVNASDMGVKHFNSLREMPKLNARDQGSERNCPEPERPAGCVIAGKNPYKRTAEPHPRGTQAAKPSIASFIFTYPYMNERYALWCH
jgi:hypothetical protein